ncbi:MAG: hypothetical protein QXH91_05300 [Candidatus Bathyarchaeia archaeon]
MGHYVVIEVSSKVRGRKRNVILKEIGELYIGELGSSFELESKGHVYDTWLMIEKGLKYIPSIVDSMFFSVGRILRELNLDWEFGGCKFLRNYEALKREMRKTYPNAAELMEKVKVKVRGDKFFRKMSGGILYGLLWPVEVVGLREVADEVGFLLKGNVFSKDNPMDKKLIEERMKSIHFSKEELKAKTYDQLIEEHILSFNGYMKHWGEFFKRAYEVHQKYKAEMWFLIRHV